MLKDWRTFGFTAYSAVLATVAAVCTFYFTRAAYKRETREEKEEKEKKDEIANHIMGLEGGVAVLTGDIYRYSSRVFRKTLSLAR